VTADWDCSSNDLQFGYVAGMKDESIMGKTTGLCRPARLTMEDSRIYNAGTFTVVR
jgi:hypothetical protein